MSGNYHIMANNGTQCNGMISIEIGILSIDCIECKGKLELANPECFIGISERIIPGFQGSIVLMGEVHKHYEGSIVETVTAYSHILKDINRLKEGIHGRKLKGLTLRMEREFKKDPLKIIQQKDRFLIGIKKTVKGKKSSESDMFLTIVESISKMIRKLDRDIKRKE